MEAALVLEITQRTFDNSDGWVHIGKIISDDDTTIRSQLHNIKNGSSLDDNIPQPTF